MEDLLLGVPDLLRRDFSERAFVSSRRTRSKSSGTPGQVLPVLMPFLTVRDTGRILRDIEAAAHISCIVDVSRHTIFH